MKKLLGYDKHNLWNTNIPHQLDELQPTKLKIQHKHQHHRLGISKIYQFQIQRCFVPRLQFLRFTAYRNPISTNWKPAVGCWHWQGNSLGKNWYPILDPKTDQNRTSGMDQHKMQSNPSSLATNREYKIMLGHLWIISIILNWGKHIHPLQLENTKNLSCWLHKFVRIQIHVGPTKPTPPSRMKGICSFSCHLFQGYLTHTINPWDEQYISLHLVDLDGTCIGKYTVRPMDASSVIEQNGSKAPWTTLQRSPWYLEQPNQPQLAGYPRQLLCHGGGSPLFWGSLIMWPFFKRKESNLGATKMELIFSFEKPAVNLAITFDPLTKMKEHAGTVEVMTAPCSFSKVPLNVMKDSWVSALWSKANYRSCKMREPLKASCSNLKQQSLLDCKASITCTDSTHLE